MSVLSDRATAIIDKLKRGSSTVKMADVVALIEDLVREVAMTRRDLLSSDKCKACRWAELNDAEVRIWRAWLDECIMQIDDIRADMEDLEFNEVVYGERDNKKMRLLSTQEYEIERSRSFAMDMMRIIRGRE